MDGKVANPAELDDEGSQYSPRELHEHFVQTFSWASTPLGDRSGWAAALRTLVGVMLGASQPMFIAWGPERTLVYNAEYISILGKKHPSALGRDLMDVWAEVRDGLTPIVDRAYAGHPVHMDDIGFTLHRNGFDEEAHFSFSYSPVRDDAGNVAGFFCACTETTAKVAADRRAEIERERIRNALELMPGFVAILAGPEHRFEYANRAYRGIIGGRDCVGGLVREVLPEVSAQGFLELLDRVYATGESFVARGMQIRLAGDPGERWLDFLYHAIRDDEGRVTGIFVGGYEVTEAVRAANQSSQERDRLAAVLDGMGEGFTLVSPDFRILDINAEGLRLDGRAKQEVVGHDHWEVHPAAEHSEVGQLLRKAMRESIPVALEHEYVWPDGHVTWLDMRAYPVPDGLAIFYRDVTDRKLAEDRVRAVSERLDLALDAGAIAGTWVWDVSKDRVVADERFARTFGVEPALVAGGLPISALTDSIHPADRQNVLEAISQAMRTGGRYRKEYRIGREGSHRWIEASGRIELDDAGNPIRFPGVIVDIDERKRAEAERDRAASLLRTFVEAVPGAVYAKDRQGRMLLANRGAAEVFGLSPAEVIGKTDAQLMNDSAASAAIMATDARIMSKGEPEQTEESIRSPNGVQTVWLSTKAPFRDERGRIVGLVGSSVEITERLRVEARRLALIKLADHLRDLSDPEDMAYAAAAIVGRTIGADRTGYGKVDSNTASVIVERDWSRAEAPSLVGVVPLRKYGTFVRDLMSGETVVINDTRIDPRTASFGVSLDSVQVRSLINVPVVEHGVVAALLFVNTAEARTWSAGEVAFVRDAADRTRVAVERCRAEVALQRLAESLEAQIAERTAERDRIWLNSRDLLTVIGEDGIIRAANPAWKEVLGFSPQAVIGRSFLSFVPEGEVAQHEDAFERTRRRERLVGVEVRCLHQDGSTRLISWSTVVEHGLIYGYGRDVTQEHRHREALRQTEELLRQSQKMEAVGQLTGGIAHDFNNMLAVVIGSLDLLQRRIGTADVRAKRYVDSATEGARRAATLTQRLLAFSRQQALRPEPLDANRLVSGMTELLRHSLGTDVRLETDLAPQLWHTYADGNQLENVILNLAVNARDAMPEGGSLTIRTQNAHLTAASEAEAIGIAAGDYILIVVADSGEGMSPEVLAKALDPFFTTKEVGKGTGLGLSQVYGFARQSGGTVKLHSELGRGTEVSVFLPKYKGELNDTGPESPDTELLTASQRELVLVVEDEPAVRAFTVDALIELGYRVVEADHAVTALQIIDSNPDIDLLFTDVVMPDVNGRKLADEARRRRPDLKVLFTSGYTRHSLFQDGVPGGGTELIRKPFTIDDLAVKLRELLDA